MPNPHKKQDTLCAYAALACGISAPIIHIATGGHIAVAILAALCVFFLICALRHLTSWGN